jgi:hypothetical protein
VRRGRDEEHKGEVREGEEKGKGMVSQGFSEDEKAECPDRDGS